MIRKIIHRLSTQTDWRKTKWTHPTERMELMMTKDSSKRKVSFCTTLVLTLFCVTSRTCRTKIFFESNLLCLWLKVAIFTFFLVARQVRVNPLQLRNIYHVFMVSSRALMSTWADFLSQWCNTCWIINMINNKWDHLSIPNTNISINNIINIRWDITS